MFIFQFLKNQKQEDRSLGTGPENRIGDWGVALIQNPGIGATRQVFDLFGLSHAPPLVVIGRYSGLFYFKHYPTVEIPNRQFAKS
jgi:hypothetical protein